MFSRFVRPSALRGVSSKVRIPFLRVFDCGIFGLGLSLMLDIYLPPPIPDPWPAPHPPIAARCDLQGERCAGIHVTRGIRLFLDTISDSSRG